MQNKRRLLKRLLREVLDESNKLYRYAPDSRAYKDSFEDLLTILDKSGYRQIASQLKSKKGVVVGSHYDRVCISLINKNKSDRINQGRISDSYVIAKDDNSTTTLTFYGKIIIETLKNGKQYQNVTYYGKNNQGINKPQLIDLKNGNPKVLFINIVDGYEFLIVFE